MSHDNTTQAIGHMNVMKKSVRRELDLLIYEAIKDRVPASPKGTICLSSTTSHPRRLT